MQQATDACFWIVGLANTLQPAAVAIAMHAADGAPIGDPHCEMLNGASRSARIEQAERIAAAHARQHSIPLHYDDDTTEFYADD